MNSLLDKYKPSCIIIEEQIISHLSFQEFYIEKINRKNFLEKIKNRDLSERDMNYFLYNMNTLLEEIDKDDFIEIMASIRPKGNEKFLNTEYLIYKQLIYFFGDEVLTTRIRQLGRDLLYLMENPKDNFRISFYDFLKSNKSFISYLRHRLEINLESKNINNFLVQHMVREKSILLDNIIENLIENSPKSKLRTWEIENKVTKFIGNKEIICKYIEKIE